MHGRLLYVHRRGRTPVRQLKGRIQTQAYPTWGSVQQVSGVLKRGAWACGGVREAEGWGGGARSAVAAIHGLPPGRSSFRGGDGQSELWFRVSGWNGLVFARGRLRFGRNDRDDYFTSVPALQLVDYVCTLVFMNFCGGGLARTASMCCAQSRVR